jgi:uncharacterized protein (UPF0335 family)
MPKYDIDNDPAFDMSEQAKAAAADRKLVRILKEIGEAEQARNEASDKIKALWKVVERQGFDVREARQRYLRTLLAD